MPKRGRQGDRPSTPIATRFWRFVRLGGPDECWEWSGHRDKNGYGRLRLSSSDRIRSNRLAWLLHNGPIPDGLCVCHRCDNPPCCNPAHLWLGTSAENTADRDAKGRHDATYWQKHLWPGPRKLTEATVAEMRALYASGYGYRKLGKRYGVTIRTAAKIVQRITWKHVA